MTKKLCFFFSLLILLCLWSCHIQKGNSPNVILILTDDQGWGDLSGNGNLDLTTPHIDQLRENGVRV
jgi:hypothetical protein